MMTDLIIGKWYHYSGGAGYFLFPVLAYPPGKTHLTLLYDLDGTPKYLMHIPSSSDNYTLIQQQRQSPILLRHIGLLFTPTEAYLNDQGYLKRSPKLYG